jgi:DNA-binding XRE family transcriptional regulator
MSGRKKFQVLRERLDERLRGDPAALERFKAAHRALRDALTLSEAREGRGVTQKNLAASLGVSQANVSRIEREGDIYLSTLRRYVEALGGHLEITAVFPDKTVAISGSGKD